MTDPKHDEIEIEQDIKVEEWQWAFQKFGALLILVIVLASVLGFLGPGPFSSAESGSADSIKVEYESKIHFGDPTTLKIEISPNQFSNGKAVISINRNYVEEIMIENIVPRPEKVEASANALTYTFATAGSGEVVPIIFYINLRTRGRVEGEILSASSEPVKINQFVFP